MDRNHIEVVASTQSGCQQNSQKGAKRLALWPKTENVSSSTRVDHVREHYVSFGVHDERDSHKPSRMNGPLKLGRTEDLPSVQKSRALSGLVRTGRDSRKLQVSHVSAAHNDRMRSHIAAATAVCQACNWRATHDESRTSGMCSGCGTQESKKSRRPEVAEEDEAGSFEDRNQPGPGQGWVALAITEALGAHATPAAIFPRLQTPACQSCIFGDLPFQVENQT